MLKYLSLIIFISLISCKRLEPLPKKEVTFIPFLSTSSLYLNENRVFDQETWDNIPTNHPDKFLNSASIFETIDWYSYDFFGGDGGHIIWSNLDIYALNTGRETLLFQIEDFYDPSQPAGANNPSNFALYSVNVFKNSELINLKIDAYACGAAQADKEAYAICQGDPVRNRYTYLNLNTLEFYKMSDSEAKTSENWHIAFKDFEVIINNGINGPGKNLAGLLIK